MFTLDPNYLKSYVDFLSDPAYEEQRSHLELETVSKEVAGYIYEAISRFVKHFLER